MLKIAIVDDDRESILLLESYLQTFGKEKVIQYTVSTFSDGKELVSAYQASYDVIFLDIEMEKMDGICTAEQVRKVDKDTIIVFVTKMAQYAMKGYMVEALDYIVKPIDYYSFELVMRKILRNLRKQNRKSIILNSKNVNKIVPCAEIYYVEVIGHYLTYHTAKGDVRLKGSLIDAKKLLEPVPFYQCNRYAIINLRHVKAIQKNSVLINDQEIEVSRSKRKEILHVVTEYLGGDL